MPPVTIPEEPVQSRWVLTEAVPLETTVPAGRDESVVREVRKRDAGCSRRKSGERTDEHQAHQSARPARGKLRRAALLWDKVDAHPLVLSGCQGARHSGGRSPSYCGQKTGTYTLLSRFLQDELEEPELFYTETLACVVARDSRYGAQLVFA